MNDNFKIAFEYNKSIIDHIKNINDPLISNYGLSLFTFRRFLNSGEFLYLCSDPQWMMCSFDNMPWRSKTFHNSMQQLTTQKYVSYIWPSLPDCTDQIYCALYDHNIWNGIIIYRKYHNYIEAYAFAATKKDSLLKNFYINNIDILNQFIIYFKNKIQYFLTPQEKKIFIPYHFSIPEKKESTIDKRDIFFQQTSFSRYYFMINDIEVALSTREIECLYYLSKGKSFKEIALILNLSARTIEHYLDNIKKKSRANKNTLIEAFSNSKLITNRFNL